MEGRLPARSFWRLLRGEWGAGLGVCWQARTLLIWRALLPLCPVREWAKWRDDFLGEGTAPTSQKCTIVFQSSRTTSLVNSITFWMFSTKFTSWGNWISGFDKSLWLRKHWEAFENEMKRHEEGEMKWKSTVIDCSVWGSCHHDCTRIYSKNAPITGKKMDVTVFEPPTARCLMRIRLLSRTWGCLFLAAHPFGLIETVDKIRRIEQEILGRQML